MSSAPSAAGQRRQRHRGRVCERCPPARSSLPELRTSRADELDRTRHRCGQRLDEVEQARIRPVDVLDERDDGAVGRDRLEVPLPGRQRSRDGHCPGPGPPADPHRARSRSRTGGPGSSSTYPSRPPNRGSSRPLAFAAITSGGSLSRIPASDLRISAMGQRATPSPYGKAAAPDDPGMRRAMRRTRARAALADPGRTDDGDEGRGAAPGSSGRAGAFNEHELAVPPDHHRPEVARLDVRLDVRQDLPGADRAVDPLERDLAQVAIGVGSAGQAPGPVRHDHRPGGRELLEPSGQADRVAGHRRRRGPIRDRRGRRPCSPRSAWRAGRSARASSVAIPGESGLHGDARRGRLARRGPRGRSGGRRPPRSRRRCTSRRLRRGA